MLYERDFINLTQEEKNSVDRAELFKKKNSVHIHGMSPDILLKYHEMLPNAHYFNDSLFPNNFLFRESLEDDKKNAKIESEFKELLDSNISERDILNFINVNKYYNLIGSVFQFGYLFGHHQAYLFKEFEFPATYKADYLLVGKASDGFSFVFIELENPYGTITNKDGELGNTFRKGIKQIEDWDSWLESNFSSLKLIFEKYKNLNRELPKEFYNLDKSRLNYVVIAGRRNDFTESTYKMRRKYMKRQNLKLMHYDNLIDAFKNLRREKNY